MREVQKFNRKSHMVRVGKREILTTVLGRMSKRRYKYFQDMECAEHDEFLIASSKVHAYHEAEDIVKKELDSLEG